MIIDERLVFSTAHDVKGAAGTTTFGSTLDAGVDGRDISGSATMPLYFCVQITTALLPTTARFIIQLATSAGVVAATGVLNTGQKALISTPLLGPASLGEFYVMPIPQAGSKNAAHRRYWQPRIVRSVATSTAINVSAWINLGYPKHMAYADAANKG